MFSFARLSPATNAFADPSRCFEPAHQRHLGRRHAGATWIATAWQEATVEQELRPVVGEPSVYRPLAQPLEPVSGPAVDAEAVDVARDGVDLLSHLRSRARAGRGRRAHERNRAQGVGEGLERVGLREGDVRGLASRLLAQAEGVVHELAPDEAPLGDAVLREQVLVGVVVHAVAHVPGRRAADRLCNPVGVVRLGDPQILRVRLPPFRMAAVVPAPVQGSDLVGYIRSRDRCEDQESSQQENDLAHLITSSKGRPQACSLWRLGAACSAPNCPKPWPHCPAQLFEVNDRA